MLDSLNVLIWAENSPRYAEILKANHLPAGTSLSIARNEEEALPLAFQTNVLICWGYASTDRFCRAAPHLRLIHSMGSGVERLLTPALIESAVPVANARGSHALPIAEHALAMMLAFSRNLHVSIRSQMTRHWAKRAAVGGEISGKTLGILGMGAIGRATAVRARALGMRVLTLRRPGREMPVEADEAVDSVTALCAASDFLLLALPLTPQTRELIGERELAAMRPHTVLVNVSRGTTVDEPALIRALEEGRLGGACLDVTAVEPLPEESPLWAMPNVIITPHVAGSSPHFMERSMALIAGNLRRLAAGEPVGNLVDKRAGY